MLFPIVLGVLTGAFILASVNGASLRSLTDWWATLA